LILKDFRFSKIPPPNAVAVPKIVKGSGTEVDGSETGTTSPPDVIGVCLLEIVDVE
jgi:hypothetical protein